MSLRLLNIFKDGDFLNEFYKYQWNYSMKDMRTTCVSWETSSYSQRWWPQHRFIMAVPLLLQKSGHSEVEISIILLNGPFCSLLSSKHLKTHTKLEEWYNCSWQWIRCYYIENRRHRHSRKRVNTEYNTIAYTDVYNMICKISFYSNLAVEFTKRSTQRMLLSVKLLKKLYSHVQTPWEHSMYRVVISHS